MDRGGSTGNPTPSHPQKTWERGDDIQLPPNPPQSWQ